MTTQTLTGMAFDVCGPLPSGTTVLEASAGTGKTHAIGALVTRYVAEGVATLDELLVVTFGRAASQELRERVRGHLVQAERALADPETARQARIRCTDCSPTHRPPRSQIRRERLRGGAGRFRRGDDRHHPSVLPIRADRAGYRRRR